MNKAVLSETKTDDAQVNDGGGFAARVFNCANGGDPVPTISMTNRG